MPEEIFARYQVVATEKTVHISSSNVDRFNSSATMIASFSELRERVLSQNQDVSKLVFSASVTPKTKEEWDEIFMAFSGSKITKISLNRASQEQEALIRNYPEAAGVEISIARPLSRLSFMEMATSSDDNIRSL